MKNMQVGTLYCTAPLSELEKTMLCKHLPPYFKIEYLPCDGTDRIFARRINIGSLSYPQDTITYHFGKSRNRLTHFDDFIAELTNVTSFNYGDQDFYPYSRSRVVGIYGISKKGKGAKKCRICILSEKGTEYLPTEIDALQFSSPESKQMEEERQRSLENIRNLIINHINQFHKLPTTDEIHQVIGNDVLIGIPMTDAENLQYAYHIRYVSKLVVDRELNIVLPDYSNMIIPLEPQQKAVYILFLKHKDEGILLSKIAEHQAELENIYSTLMPNKNEAMVKKIAENICRPSSKNLQQNISKINATFRKAILNPEISTKFCITGQRRHPYSIHIPNVELPAFFK